MRNRPRERQEQDANLPDFNYGEDLKDQDSPDLLPHQDSSPNQFTKNMVADAVDGDEDDEAQEIA